MSNTTLDNAQRVVTWIKDNNGYWNSDVLEIKESKVGGIGVFAKTDLDPTLTPKLLLRLPKESILSASKSSIANLLLEEEIEGALALIIAFIYEKHFGESSPWFEYIKTIDYKDPKGELILPPSLWTGKQKALFKGSEIELMGALDDEENKAAYETACTFALNQHEISSAIPIPWELDIEDKDDKEVFEKYKTFIAISHGIASRDFEIDQFHQIALVPGADLFNHTNKPTVRFESVFDVCPMCGSSGPCDHMDEESDDEADDESGEESGDEDDEDIEMEEGEEEVEEEGVEQENIDEEVEEEGEEQEEGGSEDEDEDGPIDEAFIEKIEKALEREKDEQARLDEEDKASEDEEDEETKSLILDAEQGGKVFPDDCCDIVLTKKVAKGEEIFNTYGDFSNSILLSKYGFVIPDNNDEQIGLGIQFIKYQKANKKLYAKHFDWWESQGYEMTREFFNKKKNESHHGCEDEDCEDEDCNDNQNGCNDGCCSGGGGNGHGDHEEEDVEEVPSWTLEVAVDSTGEPTPLTYALVKLLSLNKLELSKFLKKPEKANLQLLTTSSSKAYKILKEIIEARLKQYDDEIKYEKFLKSKNTRERLAAQLVSHEKSILQNALKSVSKKI